MSLGADILLKIRSTFESKSVDEAKKKTEELGKTTAKAGQEASSSMNVMGAATALLQGNITGALAAIAPLVEKLKVLKVTMTTISLAGALLASVVALFKNMKDRAAETAEALEKFKADSFERQVARIEAAHGKWDAANNKSLAIREAAHQFFMAENDAYKQEALAINELAKQRELANAKTEDERKIIENKFKGRADDISGAFDQKASEQEKKRLEQKAKDDEEKIRRNEKAIAEKTQFAMKRFQDAGTNVQQANQESLGWGGIKLFGNSSDTAATRYTAKADAARADSDKYFKEVEALRNENEKLKISAEQNRNMAALQEVNTRKIGVLQEAGAIATGREASTIQADIDKRERQASIQAQIDRNDSEQTAAEERFKPLIERATRNKDKEGREASEYGKAVQSYRQKGDAKGEARALQEFARENAEAEAASRALTELTQQAATTLKAIKDQANELKEQMKRINS